MAHGIRWRRSYCDHMLYLNGIWFADFCTEPGHYPLRFFVLNSPDGLIKTPPSIKQTKGIAEGIARRWRRRFRYRFAQLDDAGSDEVYELARHQAAAELGLPLSTFPEECPWTYEQIMDKDFFPDADYAPSSKRPSWRHPNRPGARVLRRSQ
jgi:hypothetical protein